ncbi:PREDICTED: balbiani ring protein 3-like [Dinoponera quadriceps]|uniref:Balbiani ring protein 3-like n=1 Tax=Dinoponera quadriceps TaxID=609295 RepID=A0A6P3Y453_DINQU|nr:PREDICTED: balbiani ring protein 3-like [Dinoponera quadriceps]
MRFLALVCFAMVSTCTTHWYDNEYSNVWRPHQGYTTGCSDKVMQLRRQMKEVKCTPRDTIVKLEPKPGFIFYPNYARVKRCGGFCVRSKSCMPVAHNMTKVAVQMHGYNTKECYNVLVEEHTKCKCHCNVKENDCNVHQQYSEDNCACECMNKQVCDNRRHMIWDNATCKCVCNKPEEVCSSGLEWVPSRCGCAKVMEMLYDKKNVEMPR